MDDFCSDKNAVIRVLLASDCNFKCLIEIWKGANVHEYFVVVLKFVLLFKVVCRERMNENWISEWMNEWMNVWINEWMNEWKMNEIWMNEWMNEQNFSHDNLKSYLLIK